MQKSAVLSPQKIQKISVAAIKHYAKKRLKEGRKQAEHLLSSGWRDPNTFFQIGIAAYNAQDRETSIILFEQALTLNSSDAILLSDIHMALGSSLSSLHKHDEAVASFNKAIEFNSKNSFALNNRALTHLDLGKTESALKDLKQAYGQSPNDPNVIMNLGDLFTKLDQEEEALKIYENALLFDPKNPSYYQCIGQLKQRSDPMSSLIHFRKAMLLDPKNEKYQKSYSDIFEWLPKLQTFEGLEKDLIHLLSSKSLLLGKLNRIVPQHIKAQPAFKEILPAVSKAIATNSELKLDYGKTVKALSNNLLLVSLTKIRLVDAELEKVLELFRRQTLTAIMTGTKFEKPIYSLLRALLIPLAHYCFSSEYLFVENEFESKAVVSLIKLFEEGGKGTPEEIILRYLILSCYRQCHRYSFSPSLSNTALFKQDKEIKELTTIQIKEPLAEAKMYGSIEKITPINDNVSLSVQEQYEENPYPRWQHLHQTGASTYANRLASILPILYGQEPNFPKAPKVLIAGCGTGRQPISTARTFPETDVLAIDLSLASISYAMRKAKELEVNNITFGQADIMELGRLDEKFSIIECGGVLHHMNDPVSGWRVLCDLLEDDGYMLIGLYSEIGRGDVVACRQFIKENQIGSSHEDIQNCRKMLMALDDSHPTKRITKQSDFYTTSACRDLIFHVQEHRFTIPQLSEILDKLGLEFLGLLPDRKRYLKNYDELFPDDPHRINMNNWQKFEETHTDVFSTMYKFWVRKKR